MSEINKKLVLGVKGIKGVATSVDWLETRPLIGNYHETYIFLPSLDKKVYKKIIEKNSSYFNILQREIFEAMQAGLNIYCISAPAIDNNLNYSMFPFDVSRSEKRIETFKKPLAGYYYPYMEWSDGYFEWKVGSSYLNKVLTSTDKVRFSWKLNSLVESLHGKLVSFGVRLTAESYEREYGAYRWKVIDGYGGGVIFVPPTTKIEPVNGLKILIGEDSENVSVEKPDWFANILLHREKELSDNLKASLSQKAKIDEEIQSIETKLREMEEFKWILRLKDKSLEKAVDEVFDFLGLPLTKGRLYQEDRWLVVDGNKIPIEIKGHENNLRRRDIRQIIDRTNEAENKSGKTAGILIANPYCNIDPSERKPSFEDTGDNIISKAVAFEVALLDTLTIFNLIKTKLEGKDVVNNLKDRLLNSSGVIKFD